MRVGWSWCCSALIWVAELVNHFDPEDQAIWADWVLMSLWLQGFKVVPLEDSECG